LENVKNRQKLHLRGLVTTAKISEVELSIQDQKCLATWQMKHLLLISKGLSLTLSSQILYLHIIWISYLAASQYPTSTIYIHMNVW